VALTRNLSPMFIISVYNIDCFQAIYKLNLDSLLYDDDVIELSSVECIPSEFEFQPIGGVLRVTCRDGKRINVDASSGRILNRNAVREFVSGDSRHAIQTFGNDVIVFRISESGRYEELIVSKLMLL